MYNSFSQFMGEKKNKKKISKLYKEVENHFSFWKLWPMSGKQ